MDKILQGCADIINECIQCGKCKHLAYVEDADYMECSLGIEENTKGKCEKFEKVEDGSKPYGYDCEDKVWRSDVIDLFGHGSTYTSEEAQKMIKNLPSAEVDDLK